MPLLITTFPTLQSSSKRKFLFAEYYHQSDSITMCQQSDPSFCLKKLFSSVGGYHIRNEKSQSGLGEFIIHVLRGLIKTLPKLYRDIIPSFDN